MDQVAAVGKYEIDGQSNKLRLNGSNVDDTACETPIVFQRKAAGGNMGFGTTSQFEGGQGVIATANACLAPSVNPAAAGIFYIEEKALKYLRPNGTVTTGRVVNTRAKKVVHYLKRIQSNQIISLPHERAMQVIGDLSCINLIYAS